MNGPASAAIEKADATTPEATRAGAVLIDGRAHADDILAQTARDTALFVAETGVRPGLAVVLVGDDPASAVYVRAKGRRCVAAGMRSFEHLLPAATDQAALLGLLAQLNADPEVNAILVQLPLPVTLDAAGALAAIDPDKDVDGFHLLNAGRLATGADGVVPCTPRACLLLLRATLGRLRGLHAVVLGRSNIVGKPMARLLLGEDCTVTLAHSHTRDLPSMCRQADILVVAVGRPLMVRGDWIKPGAAVIDVGINRVQAGDGRAVLVGDVAFEEARRVAGWITPVPGGVGPMTIACLLRNTLQAARRQRGMACVDR